MIERRVNPRQLLHGMLGLIDRLLVLGGQAAQTFEVPADVFAGNSNTAVVTVKTV